MAHYWLRRGFQWAASGLSRRAVRSWRGKGLIQRVRDVPVSMCIEKFPDLRQPRDAAASAAAQRPIQRAREGPAHCRAHHAWTPRRTLEWPSLVSRNRDRTAKK